MNPNFLVELADTLASAIRIKLWVYTTLGVGVGIVLGILLGELIF